MRSRVLPGSLVTIALRVPVSLLNKVALPTFGRPTITSDASFFFMWALTLQHFAAIHLPSGRGTERERRPPHPPPVFGSAPSKGDTRPVAVSAETKGLIC